MKKKYSEVGVSFLMDTQIFFGELYDHMVYDLVDRCSAESFFDNAFSGAVKRKGIGEEVKDYLREAALDRVRDGKEWLIVVHDALSERQIDPTIRKRWDRFGFGPFDVNAKESYLQPHCSRLIQDDDTLICIKRPLMRRDVQLWIFPLRRG